MLQFMGSQRPHGLATEQHQSKEVNPNIYPIYSNELILNYLQLTYFLVQLVKNLPAMQETLVRFLGREDPLEKG